MGQQSFTPEEILAASFAYTRTTVEGAGAIKGKNCQIQSIDPITGGVRITFVWYLDDGTEQTDTADVMNGADGKGIKSVAIDADEHLIITYTDNTTSDAGKIEVKSAVTSVNGKKGDVQLKTSDITNDSDYVSDANYVHTDNNYDNTAKGIVDGVTAELAKKVDKVTGKDLSTNDYTNADKAIVDNVTTNLAGKVDKVTGKDLSTNDYTNADKAIVDGVTTALANKVDKVSGKDLSTNDYTNADKAIVDGVTAELANKADTTDVIDSASYDSTNHTILFKHGSTTLFSLDAAAFVKDGMIDTVTVTGGNLVITFNTDAGKQDISIPISDIFDANNYYNKTAIDNLLGTKQDTLTFDNTPTAGSNNPVKSGGIHSELSNKVNTSDIVNNLTTEVEGKVLDARQGKQLDSSIQTLKQQINNNGSKNVLPCNMYSSRAGNVYFDYLYDGTFTATDTANTDVWKKYLSDAAIEVKEPMMFVGTPSTGSSSTWFFVVSCSDGTDYRDYGDGVVIPVGKIISTVWIVVKSGKNPNGTLFKPMLCLKSVYDLDPTFEPYAKTNQLLTKETTGLIDNQNVNGAVNMLPNNATTQVVNGVTFTVNDDGTVTANGTATATAFIIVGSFTGVTAIRMTGCPTGGAQNNHYMQLKQGNSWLNIDYGKGTKYQCDDSKVYEVAIVVYSGITVSNVIFKPMISLASMNLSYDDYVPYAKSNKELTDLWDTNKYVEYELTSGGDTDKFDFENADEAVFLVNTFTRHCLYRLSNVPILTGLTKGQQYQLRSIPNAVYAPSKVVYGTAYIRTGTGTSQVYYQNHLAKGSANINAGLEPHENIPAGALVSIGWEWSY